MAYSLPPDLISGHCTFRNDKIFATLTFGDVISYEIVNHGLKKKALQTFEVWITKAAFGNTGSKSNHSFSRCVALSEKLSVLQRYKCNLEMIPLGRAEYTANEHLRQTSA